ncbi:hypothetical protein ElyMa_001968500 [Elysia marginata]|uniref:Uncharacterized protein n=1 Tax=Elysia marginata TaxID=1093978 RepID=A0AAV4F1P2_9GAST|nr:hypothetical protein ElyMa_001968500 [Elysia marginata]
MSERNGPMSVRIQGQDEKEGRGCRTPLAPLAPLAPQRPSKGPHQLQTEAPPARLTLPAPPRPARHFCPTASKISPSLASLPAAPRPYLERLLPHQLSLESPLSQSASSYPASQRETSSDSQTLQLSVRQ